MKRDILRAIERQCHKRWESEGVFESNPDLTRPKYMITFPFPYMNGRLHLGHAFTITKAEFQAGYQRMKGKNVLFPFGFHGTGMPIKACADKLAREFEMDLVPRSLAQDEINDIRNGKSSGSGQWRILVSMGVDFSELTRFTDPYYWLEYFPPRAKGDLQNLGVKVDWRRSFITTDMNPYFDSFVRWQLQRLKDLGKIKFGKRYTIMSPHDGPCMDHDRQIGEGVSPQEYTLVKMRLDELPSSLKQLEGRRVFLVAATLRPETMYGQTNCFVKPSLSYGAYQMRDGDVFLCTERAARNLAYQDATQEHGQVKKLGEVRGESLLGSVVDAPLSLAGRVPVLPMTSIDPNKGTGIVTSVPSDSPDDFAMLMDLKKKPEYYGVDADLVNDLHPFKVIETPSFGSVSAQKAVEQLKIQSPKERVLLDQAKQLIYREGFYDGKMLVGDFAGMAVKDAKDKIRDRLIDDGLACTYFEPESRVVSRSGDECVVGLVDQWYVTYGENEWKAKTRECIRGVETYHDETKDALLKTIDWLHEWGCSRMFGLGTRLPWDDKWLIESLSDSTIYMAYYSVAHFLQSSIDGATKGQHYIKPEDITPAVWDFIFGFREEPPEPCAISRGVLDEMKQSFEYYYPVDLRVSGKDLIQNHLTFMLHTHTAMFPKEKWPRSIRINGHLLIDNEKMSKSTGNFLTLHDAIERYGADATRMALAEAGDRLDDANFESSVANSCILKLHTLLDWISEHKSLLSHNQRSETFFDQVFEHEMRELLHKCESSYDSMLYYDALKYGFHEMLNARDRYIQACAASSSSWNPALISKFVDRLILMMSPITPHFSEHVWS